MVKTLTQMVAIGTNGMVREDAEGNLDSAGTI